MRNLIFCLGFNPKNDGVILPILEERLKDCMELCKKTPGSLLILSGGYTFRERDPNGTDQSLLMKKYVQDHAPNILDTTEIITDNRASTTVRELCFLREFIDSAEKKFKVTIVASDFFIDRVRLYSEYIFQNLEDIEYVPSAVPSNEMPFQEIEADKYKKGVEWLQGHKKGDYITILNEQDDFEKKILSGEIKHSVSK